MQLLPPADGIGGVPKFTIKKFRNYSHLYFVTHLKRHLLQVTIVLYSILMGSFDKEDHYKVNPGLVLSPI